MMEFCVSYASRLTAETRATVEILGMDRAAELPLSTTECSGDLLAVLFIPYFPKIAQPIVIADKQLLWTKIIAKTD